MIQNLKYYLKSCNIEPCYLIYTFALLLSYPTFNALVYQKSTEFILCSISNDERSNVQLLYPGFSFFICEKVLKNSVHPTYTNNDKVSIDILIQTLASQYIFYSTLVQGISTIFLALLVGSWSDRFGRKAPVFSSYIGGSFSALMSVFVSLYPSLNIKYIFIGPIFEGLFGNVVIQLLAIFSFISHYSLHGERTIKFAILETCGLVGIILGTFTSAILLKFTSLYIIYLVILFIHLLNIVCLTVIFKINSHKLINHSSLQLNINHILKSINICKILKNIFNSIKKSRVPTLLLILIFLLILLTFVTIGEFDTWYLFVVSRFSWSASKFATFLLVWKLAEIIGLIVALPILQNHFHMSDTGVALLGFASKAFGLIALGAAPNGHMTYLAAVISFLDNTPSTVLRSALSKLVPKEDVGKVFSLMASLQACTSILASLFYTRVYALSLNKRSWIIGRIGNGFVYYFSAFLLAWSIPMLYYLKNRLPSRQSHDGNSPLQSVHSDSYSSSPNTSIDQMSPNNASAKFYGLSDNPADHNIFNFPGSQDNYRRISLESSNTSNKINVEPSNPIEYGSNFSREVDENENKENGNNKDNDQATTEFYNNGLSTNPDFVINL